MKRFLLTALLCLVLGSAVRADTPDDAVRDAVTWVSTDLKNTYVPNLRFISLYNEQDSSTYYDIERHEDIKFSPIDETMKVLLWTANQLNLKNPPVQFIKINQRLVAIDITTAGWTPAAWDKFALSTTYFSPDWVQLAHWNYLTAATGSAAPIVRADEFIAKSTIAPAYYDFLFGVDAVKTRDELFTVLGQDPKFVLNAGLVHAGTKTRDLEITRYNRRLEFRPGPFWLWTSQDTDSNVEDANVHNRLGFVGGPQTELRIAGQEHIFPLRWGGFGGYLNTPDGKRVDEVPIAIAPKEKNFPDHRVRAGRSCITCHTSAVRSFTSDHVRLLEKQIVTLQTSTPEAEKVLSNVYEDMPVQDTLEDQQRAYERSVKRLLGLTGIEISNKYKATWNRYVEDEVTLDTAAREMGCSREQLIAVLLPAIDPNLLTLLPQDGQTNTAIPRDVWESVYRKAMLAMGRPEANAVVQGLPAVPQETKPAAQVLQVVKPVPGQSVVTEVQFSDIAIPEVETYKSDKPALVKVGAGKAGTGEKPVTRTYPITLTTAENGEFPTWVEFTMKGSGEVLRFEVKP